MPDNLTLKFQRELEERANRVTTPTPTPGVPAAGKSLWETIGTAEEPEWMKGALDREGNIFRTAGKGMWAALETAAIGIPGMAARAIAPDWYQSMQPVTFAERVATGIGTVGGFIVPFGLARGVAARALKGAKVLRDGKVVAYGSTSASEKFVSNATRVLKADPAFRQWYAKQGLDPKKVNEWIKKSGLLDAPKSSIKNISRATFGSSHAMRAQYSANVVKNTEGIIRSKVDDMAKALSKKGESIPFAVDDKAIKLISKEVEKYVGGKYKFPVTNLHQYLSAKWGNSSLASIAASSAEEAILFSAVELPMNAINSVWNEDIDWAPFSTLGHAMLLGSALGAIRLIPGGRDLGILKGAWGKTSQLLTRRKRWSQYDVTESSERMLLAKRADELFDRHPELFKSLESNKIFESGKKGTVADRRDLSRFAESESQAKKLRSFMSSIEKSFYKDWWPGFLKDSATDIFGSIPRMVAGSIAFNFGLFNEYRQGNVPTEDMVFHTLLGAVLSKKGRDIEYVDHNGNTQVLPAKRRPYVYSDSFEKVDSYLNSLGMGVDHHAFRNLMNNIEILKKRGKPDYSNEDLQLLLKSFEDSKFIVDGAEGQGELKNEKLKGHELYDGIKIVVEGMVGEGKRVKEVSEITEGELAEYLLKIRGMKFQSLSDWRTEKVQGGTGLGIYGPSDVSDILASAARPNIKAESEMHLEAVKAAYNELLKVERDKEGRKEDDWVPIQEDENGTFPFRPIRYDNVDVLPDYRRALRVFGNGRLDGDENFKSALGIIRKRVNRETIKSGADLVLDREGHMKLFGNPETGDRGIMDAYDRELTTQVFGEGSMSDDALLHVGDDWFIDHMQLNMFVEGIRDTWKQIGAIKDKDKSRSWFGDDVDTIYNMVNDIFTGPDARTKLQPKYARELPESIDVYEAGKPVHPSSKEQLFAGRLLEILKTDPERAVARYDLIGPIKKQVEVGKITTLMENFEKFGLLDPFTGPRETVDLFVENLASYTRHKGLQTAVRNDGDPLTPKNLAFMSLLARNRLMGPNYDMVNLDQQIGEMKNMFLKKDIIFKHNLTADDQRMIKTNFAGFLETNDSKVTDILQDMKSANEDLYNLLYKAVENMEAPEYTMSKLLNSFVGIYEKELAPLWRTQNGLGILKETPIEAAATSDFLSKLVAEIQSIKDGSINMTHRELVSAIDEVYFNTTSNKYKDFLSMTLNSIYDRKGDVTRVMQILESQELYSVKDRKFLLDEEDKRFDQKIKEASRQIQIATQSLPVEREIDILMERDKQDFTPKTHSDIHITMTLEKFKSDWNLGWETPDLQYGMSPARMIEDIITNDYKGGFTLKNFFDYTVKAGTLRKEIDGKVYTEKNWRDMPDNSLMRLGMDAIKVWSGIIEGVKTRNIVVGEEEAPLDKPQSARRNDLTDFQLDKFGEVVYIDPKFMDINKIARHAKEVDPGLLSKFYASAGKVGHRAEARLARNDSEAWEFFAGDKKPTSGYVAASLGDLDSFIGIPIFDAKAGEGLRGVHRIADDWVKMLYAARETYSDNPNISRLIDRMIDQYVETSDTRIVEPFEIDENDNPISYSFKGVIPHDTRTAANATVMFTTTFGDNVFGKNFWDSLVNIKADQKGWSSTKEFAHDFLRRIRLFTNRSTTNLSRERIAGIVDFMDSNFYEDANYRSVMPDVVNVVNRVLKPIQESGDVGIHIIRDEAISKDDRNPVITSAFENFRQQIMASRAANRAAGGNADIIGLESDGTYPGGIGDTSHFNSVVVVSRDFMEALKIMTGDFHRRDSLAGKPVIAFADNGKAAFLGKTMFMVDERFEPYLSRNNINMALFTSASKTIGDDYQGNIIDMNQFDTMDQFLGSTNTGMRTVLPIEAIQIQNWQAGDKPARIPMHVGNELAGEALNNEYFNWLNRPAVRKYEEGLSSIMGGGNISRMTGFAKMIMGQVGDDVDNTMYSTMSRWLNVNGYPMFLPFKNSMKNAMMREFIDKSGMISPENHFGSHSVLVPSYYEFDHVNGLRNSEFHNVALKDEKGRPIIDEDGNTTVNPDIYSYGQVEIGMNNASKPFDDRNVNIVVHRENAADQLLNWSDFVGEIKLDAKRKQVSRVYISRIGERLNDKMRGNVEGFIFDIKGVRRKASKLKDIYDWLEDLNDNYMDANVRAEVEVVIQRTPSTRPSDKVIAGLKGFIEGNFARLNTIDLWTRLEADHDLDTVNYWWDTPTNILNEWRNNASRPFSIVDDSPHTSLDGLDVLSPESFVKYNFDSHRASKKRGEVVKLKNLYKYIRHYSGIDGSRGYNITIPNDRVIRIDPDIMDGSDIRLTKDIQRIVDSKDGFEEDAFTPDYTKDMLFGREDWNTKSIFIKGNPNDAQLTEKLSPLEEDIISLSLQPYKGFLQLATDVYEGGEAVRVNYDSFITGFETYSDAIKNLEAYVIRGLGRRGWSIDDYRDYFYKDGKPIKIFGLQDARMPTVAKRGDLNYRTGRKLLPFDRSIWAAASIDRMGLSAPHRTHEKSESDFDKVWDKFIDEDFSTDEAVKRIVQAVKIDAKNIAFLNVIDRRIRSAKSGQIRAKRYNDEGLNDWLQDRMNRLIRVRDGLNDRILSDENTAGRISETIQRQLRSAIIKGQPVDLVTIRKRPDGTRVAGPSQRVGPQQTGWTVKKRKQWIENNTARIGWSTWRNNKLAIEIRGISSNDYAQMVMWHKTLSEKTGFSLDPRFVPYALEFENSVFEAKSFMGKEWNSWFENRDYAPHEREDIVQAEIMRHITEQWVRWNDIEDGLGNLWILKLMTPEPDGTIATYHQGHFLPGFREIDKQVKYTTLGLNFLATNPETIDIPLIKQAASEAGISGRAADVMLGQKQLIFRELADSFTDKMRALYNQELPRQDVSKMSASERMKSETGVGDLDPNIFAADNVALSGNVSDAIEGAKSIYRAIDADEMETIYQLNPDMKLLYGVTGDISLDYLALRGAPVGTDMLLDIKKMAEFYFMPNKALNSRGKLRNIESLKSYYGFVRRDAKIYFGDLADKNMLVRDKLPTIDMNPFGKAMEKNVETGEHAKQRWRNNVLGCI